MELTFGLQMQMMSDEYRGWAWTRAFLGLQADEIHVCGDPSAVPLLHSLCAATGDELVQNDYERFKPLTIDHVNAPTFQHKGVLCCKQMVCFGVHFCRLGFALDDW
jgi:hypothetical protein